MSIRPLIGAHVSTAGGLYRAIGNGELIGAETIQIFGSSPQQWLTRMPSPADIADFKKHLAASRIQAVYLHASYLVNLASPVKLNWDKSVKSLIEHLKIAELIGADGLIFHVGSKGESDREDAIKRVTEGMRLVLKDASGKAKLVLENSAGGGNKIGNIPEDIGEILQALDSPRAAVCLDTAHAFEAGQIEAYTPLLVKKFFDHWDKHIGLKNIVALHANDSMTKFDSHHDRHENIGKGFIGLDGFKALAKEQRIAHAAWLLEVPGLAGLGPDKANVEILKSCFE